MIPKELDELIQEYLTDGVITTKERMVLLKKAEKMGLDVDEVDLYIDAQQQKVDQQVDAAASKKRGKVCPFCNGPVPQLVDKCPHCGEFITPEASDELKEILEKLEDALVDFKSGRNIDRSKATVERYSRKAKTYYGNNPKIQKLLAEVEAETRESEQKAIEAEQRARSEAKSAARKETATSILKNIWTWVAIEAVTFTLAFLHYHNLADELLSNYNNAPVTPARHAIYDEYQSAGSMMYMCFILGAIVIGFTVYIALKKKK